MTTDPSFALQAAIVGALSVNAPLRALISTPARVYDDVPSSAPFPYVTLGHGTLGAWDTSSDQGHAHTLLINAWSRQGGRKEAKAILSAIYDVLHNAPLTLSGNRLVLLRFEFADIFRDADGETMHGVARYRALTELT